MAGKWLRARQTKYAAYASVYILVVVTIIVVVNVLANRYNRSWDSTANKRYTLSEQTAKIVHDLKQNAHIQYYDQTSRFGGAHDLLDRYANLSSKVDVQYIDPDKDPQVARAAGITSYGTAVIAIGDKKEQAKAITEEGISGAFIRALKNTVRNVCFVTGSGEHRIDDTERNGFSNFKDQLTKDNYTSKSISLLQESNIPGDCTVIVLGGPTTEYLPNAVASIQKYVEDGGRALILLDPPLKVGKPTIADNDALTKVLTDWGVTLAKDVILDLNPLGQIAGVGPQVALVNKYDFAPDRQRDERRRDGISPGAVDANQEHGQDRRTATVQFIGQQPGDGEFGSPHRLIRRTPKQKGPVAPGRRRHLFDRQARQGRPFRCDR